MLFPQFGARVRKTRALLAAHNVDAFIIFSASNLHYLTNYHGEVGTGILTPRNFYLITDYRFHNHAQSHSVGCTLVCRDRDRQTLEECIAEILRSETSNSAAFESEHTTHEFFTKLHTACKGNTLRPRKQIVETLRTVKDAWELAQIQKAADIADTALANLLPKLNVGITERDVARELQYLMLALGADDVAFPPIVGFGPNSALPHCVPSDRALQKGDLALIDFGATVNRYRSDMTRTFVAGAASERQRDMIGTVLRAQSAALCSLKSGMVASDINRAAEEELRRSAFASFTGEGLGHGVGLDLHEAPYLGRNTHSELPAKSIITVEPGIYIPSYGGVRFEDDVLIHEAGYTAITRSPIEFELDV
jgi:Xaa-Pro aminopeptidase